MEYRTISEEVYERVIEQLPNFVIQMLPEDPKRLLKYAKRRKEIKFSKGINDDVKELMRQHLLSDEEYLKTFYYVMAVTFYNKKPVKNPKMYVVVAQTGSGKSHLTAKLLRENENCIFVDSDKYKHFRFDAQKIAKEHQDLYAFLTGPDSYGHADNVFEYALINNYNIIRETAPTSDMVENFDRDISVYVLAVNREDSLKSIRERYELQLLHGLKTAKLTGVERHNESYEALEKYVLEMQDKVSMSVYRRGTKENNFVPLKVYPSGKYKNAIEALKEERKIK